MSPQINIIKERNYLKKKKNSGVAMCNNWYKNSQKKHNSRFEQVENESLEDRSSEII
mgnify:CR=1 FL=1